MMMIQFKNFEQWLARIVVISFCGIMLATSFYSRKPLCFDSKIIAKINLAEESVMYKCSSFKTAPLSGYLAHRLTFLNSSLKIEKYLSALAPFKKHLQIHILPNNGSEYLLQDGQLIISKNIFEATGIRKNFD